VQEERGFSLGRTHLLKICRKKKRGKKKVWGRGNRKRKGVCNPHRLWVISKGLESPKTGMAVHIGDESPPETQLRKGKGRKEGGGGKRAPALGPE